MTIKDNVYTINEHTDLIKYIEITSEALDRMLTYSLLIYKNEIGPFLGLWVKW